MTSDSVDNPAAENEPQKKTRSTLERCVVWGLIGGLGVVCLIEARAQFGYAQSLDTLQQAIADADPQLTLAEARKCMSFAPSESGPVPDGDRDGFKYEWFSVFKSGQFVLSVKASRDAEPLVVGFSTPGAPEEKVLPRSEFQGEGDDPGTGGIPIMGGGPPGMGRGTPENNGVVPGNGQTDDSEIPRGESRPSIEDDENPGSDRPSRPKIEE